jgi:hypothetical protein
MVAVQRLRASPHRRQASPTGRHRATAPDEHPVLELQRLIGNQAVTALVQREEDEEQEVEDQEVPATGEVETTEETVEEENAVSEETAPVEDETGPVEDETSPAESEAGPSEETEVDEAADDGLPSPEDFDAAFVPENVMSSMSSLGESDLGSTDTTVAQAIRVQRDQPTTEPPAPKAASAGDLLEALSKLAEMQAALDRLKALFLKSWEDIKKGTSVPEKIVIFGSAGLILGGGAAGALSNKDSRGFVFKSLDGVKIPIPGLDGLSVTPKFDDKGFKGGMVELDVLKLFPGLRKTPVFQ